MKTNETKGVGLGGTKTHAVMNILMLGWELPPHNSGGLGVACLNMSRALARAGASIDFVVPYRAPHADITFMQIHAATDLPPLYEKGLGAYSTQFETVVNGKHLANDASIREIQAQYTRFIEGFVARDGYTPDAIHAHDWLTVEAAIRAKQLTGAPLIVHVHATEFDRAGGEHGNPLIHEIEQQGLLMADRIIAVSNFTKQLIVARYGIPADKIEVIHNALEPSDIEHFAYDQRTYRYLEALKREGHTVVATVTRFTIQKGLIQFLHAAARASRVYDKLVFLLAGDGEQRDELLRLSAELGIADKVFFTGFVRGQQWCDSFRVADIFVMSSVSEPFGLTALEAAHFGNALVITRQSGVGEVLQSIFRYDFWDSDRLADQLVAIATSQALKSTLQQNAANEYAKISWRDVAEQCLSLYRKLRIGAAG